jgi:hypothetical protein
MRVFSTFTPAFVVAIAWMVFFVIAGNLASPTVPLSKSGKWFFAKWWYHNNFARRCVTAACPNTLTQRQV